LPLAGHVLDRQEINAVRLGAIDGEEVNLAVVRAAGSPGVRVVPVMAAKTEHDGPLSQATRLALNPAQLPVALHDEIAPRVLAERDVEPVPKQLERGHSSKCGAVTYVLGVFHVVRIAYTSDATIGRAPE
jgi:hypothetical protein